MSYYVKPSSDIFIKYLLGSVENKSILLAFINGVLSRCDFDKIVDVEVLNPFNIKEFRNDKESILDVKATDENGRIYDIEVQTIGNESYVFRSLYYWACLYSSQLIESDIYSKLKPTISINIIEFDLFKQHKNYFSSFLLKEIESNEILTDHLLINYIELSKFNSITESDDELNKLLYFLKNEGKEDQMLKTLIKNDKILDKAHNEYRKFTGDKAMRELYDSRIKYQRDYNSLISDAKLEGEQKGKLEGKLEGEHEGRLDSAKNLKQLGVSIDLISQATGLSKDEIDKL